MNEQIILAAYEDMMAHGYTEEEAKQSIMNIHFAVASEYED